MPKTSNAEFSIREGFAFCCAMIGVQLSSEFITQWGTYFYSPTPGSGRIIYVGIGLVGTLFLLGRIFDVVTDPLVGVWSDRTRRTFWPVAGRRRPFIFWGSIFMAITSIGFWYPPVAGESAANFAFAAFVLCIHWGWFTICAVPLYALAPEIARSEQARVNLGTWMGIGTTLGVALAIGLSGELITRLDPARQATATGAFSPEGYRRTAILFAILALAAFQFFVWTVRERFRATGQTGKRGLYQASESPSETGLSPLSEMWTAVKNPLFLHYFAILFTFNLGYLAAQRVLPYWAEVGLGGDEATVTRLVGPFILGCLLSAGATPLLAKKIRVKWLMVLGLFSITASLPLMYPIGKSGAGYDAKVLMGGALFGFAGLGQGMMYILVIPLLGMIIDRDEKVCGRRREAVYNALYNLTWKGALGLSVWLAAGVMAYLGNTPDNPRGVLLVGPLGGLLGLMGLTAALFYPNQPVSEGKAED